MFWGVSLESGKRYSQVVESSFHLSMAALEPTTKEMKKSNSYVSVMIDHSKTEFLLCTLEYGRVMQVALDLLFVEGEEVSFFLNGEGTVHLTGYVISDDGEEMDSDVSGEEALSELSMEVEEEENGEDWSRKKAKKRKPSKNIEVNTNKKVKNEKTLKQTSPQKAPKVDIVEMPSSLKNFSASKSPFATKMNDVKSKGDKNTPQINKKVNDRSKDSDDDSEDNDEWEDDDDDDEGGSEEDVNSDIELSSDSEDEQDENEFVPKPKVMSNKKMNMNEKNKKSPGVNLQQKGDGDAKNLSFTGKQNKVHEQKTPGSGKKDSFRKQNTSLQEISPKTPKMRLQGGVEIEEIRVGNGPVAKPGKNVHVYYMGKLPNNKEFDSVTKGKPFAFRLGKGEVIKGWDVALQGMKVGGKRNITIPPHMGYGNKASGPIPANSTLHFEVELKAVS